MMAQKNGGSDETGRVLVVDDTPANVRLLSGILKVAGYDVVTASSACTRSDVS